MRKSYSNQLRLDSVPIEQVELNLVSRDRIVPILRALQFLYSDRKLIDEILQWIADDVNSDSLTVYCNISSVNYLCGGVVLVIFATLK